MVSVCVPRSARRSYQEPAARPPVKNHSGDSGGLRVAGRSLGNCRLAEKAYVFEGYPSTCPGALLARALPSEAPRKEPYGLHFRRGGRPLWRGVPRMAPESPREAPRGPEPSRTAQEHLKEIPRGSHAAVVAVVFRPNSLGDATRRTASFCLAGPPYRHCPS